MERQARDSGVPTVGLSVDDGDDNEVPDLGVVRHWKTAPGLTFKKKKVKKAQKNAEKQKKYKVNHNYI